MLTDIFVVVVRAQDVEKIAGFYGAILGLEPVHAVPGGPRSYQLPSGVRFEVAPGGVPQPAPSDRTGSRCTTVFNATDFEATFAQLQAHGATVVNPPFSAGAFRVAYLADPEGNVFGLREV